MLQRAASAQPRAGFRRKPASFGQATRAGCRGRAPPEQPDPHKGAHGAAAATKAPPRSPGLLSPGKERGKRAPNTPPCSHKCVKAAAPRSFSDPKLCCAPLSYSDGKGEGDLHCKSSRNKAGAFFRREGGRPQGPRRRRRLRAVTLCPVLAGPQKPYKWARGGGTKRCGSPPKRAWRSGRGPSLPAPRSGPETARKSQQPGGCRISFGRCEKRGKRSTHRSPARTGHGHRRAARSAPKSDPKYSPRAPESTPGSMGGTNASEAGPARPGTAPGLTGGWPGTVSTSAGLQGRGRGGRAFGCPQAGAVPWGPTLAGPLSSGASSLLTVSRPFICPPLARRDSVLDRLSISSMIPWIWPPEIPWKSMAGGRKGQVFSSALHPTISIYRPQSL